MKPHIVFLHAHNIGNRIQPYGYPVPTPHLQRLAEQGVVFRKAFCVSPTCSPSRASFMTGQWPHTCGMLGLGHRGFRLHDYRRTLIRLLGDAGYETVRAGLQHIAPEDDMLEYTRDLAHGIRKHPGREVADRAVAFLRAYRGDRPLFLDVGINKAHKPYPDPSESGVDARYTRGPASLPDTLETRHEAAGLVASARDMDDAFGRVLDALEEAGMADQTLVIALSDHGLQWPFHMCNLTDHGLETFLILRGPQKAEGEAGIEAFRGGQVCDAMVTHIDLLPTICDMAGIATPEWVQGTCMMPLMQGKVDKLHDAIFGEITYHAAYEPQRCIRTERYKYIRRFGDRHKAILPNIDRGPTRDMLLREGLTDWHHPVEALYDLLFDPQEAHNLIGNPGFASVADELRAKLEDWMRATDDPLLRGPVPAPSGAQVNHPDGLHPMDRVETVP